MKAHAIIFSSSQTHLFRRIMYRLAIGQIGVFEQPEYLNKIKVAYPLSDIAVRDIAAYMALFQRKRIAKFAPKKTNSILKIITHFVLTQNVESSWASSSCGLLKKFTSISRKMCKICFQIIDKDSDKDYCDICTDIAKLYPRLFAEMERNQLCETN
ncbi:hypothetical protein GJ496_001133 [Pomphorhynchus laevis]|nr:hypothetical protein GJ496_001133 [Pomphorhynchus laevis]